MCSSIMMTTCTSISLPIQPIIVVVVKTELSKIKTKKSLITSKAPISSNQFCDRSVSF